MGFPGSGKSTIVDLVSSYSDFYLIRPSDLYPPNINALDDEEQQAIRLASWDTALDDFKVSLGEGLIVLDACNSDYETVEKLVNLSKSYDHEVVVIFTKASEDACLKRLSKDGKRVGAGLFAKYQGHYTQILSKIIFDMVLVVNTEDKENIKSQLKKIIQLLKNGKI